MLNDRICFMTGRLCSDHCVLHFEDTDGGNRCSIAELVAATKNLVELERADFLKQQEIKQMMMNNNNTDD